MRGKMVLNDILISVKAFNALLLSNALLQYAKLFYALTALTFIVMSLSTLLAPPITHMELYLNINYHNCGIFSCYLF